MFQLPAPPPILVTRQIECVSCKQLYTIAVDTPITDHTGGNDWHLAPDHHTEITLRERPVWGHRSVMPPARAQPEESHHNPTQLADDRPKFYINCPRCGADNRNWMQIVHVPPIGDAPDFPMAKLVFLMYRRFPLALIGFIITISITFATFGISIWTRESIGQMMRYTLPQTLFVFLAGFVPTLLITQQWQRLRDYKNLHRYLGPRSLVDRILLPQLNSLFYLGVFLVVIPLLLYFVIPWAFNTAFSLISTTPETTDTSKELFAVDKQFLKAWFWTVGLSGLIAVIFAVLATERFVGQVNSQVPPPIFYSIANMTRVVVWEAKHALEIPGDMSNIQWSYIKRNERGGIVLQGVYREPVLNGYRADLYHRVRAQIYTISTDLWGRIETADIQTTTVPQSPEPPSVSMAHDLFRHTLPASNYPAQLLR